MNEREELAALAASLRGHLLGLKRFGMTHVLAPARTSDGQEGSSPGALLAKIRGDLGDCKRCGLAAGRTNIVFGVGNPQAELLFVGEAPGANEDVQGEPFVGEAGQLLTKMIAAMGFRRDDVYIANIVKCRPPKNRNPLPEEIAACEPFLLRQVGAIRPRVIVALGSFAARTLLRMPDAPISALRGRFHEVLGMKVMPTYHPAYLLRNPAQKRAVWDDLQAVMKELAMPGAEGG